MAILKVARLGHPVLRAKALPVPASQISSPVVQRLIDDMFETMAEYSGIGLAAPQIHESLSIFVAGVRPTDEIVALHEDDDMPYLALINPEITPASEETSDDWEGCLSIPDIRGLVPRARAIRVTGWDRNGQRVAFEASGLPARVIQHETDHLHGVLFLDRMKSFDSLTYMEEYRRHWMKDDGADGSDDAGDSGDEE